MLKHLLAIFLFLNGTQEVELWLQTVDENKTVLRDVLSRFQDDYDYILIDCACLPLECSR